MSRAARLQVLDRTSLLVRVLLSLACLASIPKAKPAFDQKLSRIIFLSAYRWRHERNCQLEQPSSTVSDLRGMADGAKSHVCFPVNLSLLSRR